MTEQRSNQQHTQALTEAEQQRARENWEKMPPDMREFTAALVGLGMVDGRRGLAQAEVAVLPDRLPVPDESKVWRGPFLTGREMTRGFVPATNED